MSSNQPRQTKAQRREAARLKAKELREAAARRARRNTIARRSFIGVAGLGVTGGLGYLVYRGVDAKNGTKDTRRVEVPRTERGPGHREGEPGRHPQAGSLRRLLDLR